MATHNLVEGTYQTPGIIPLKPFPALEMSKDVTSLSRTRCHLSLYAHGHGAERQLSSKTTSHHLNSKSFCALVVVHGQPPLISSIVIL